MLHKIIERESLSPSQIWNYDESGFPSDPECCSVINITCGSGRENTARQGDCALNDTL